MPILCKRKREMVRAVTSVVKFSKLLALSTSTVPKDSRPLQYSSCVIK